MENNQNYLYVPRQPNFSKQQSEEVRQRQFMMQTMKDLHIFYTNQLQMDDDFQLQSQFETYIPRKRSFSIQHEPRDYFYYYNPIISPKQVVSQESLTGLLTQALELHSQLLNAQQQKQQFRYQVINKLQQLHRVLGSEIRPSKVVQQLKNTRLGRWETSVALSTTDLTIKQLSTALLTNFDAQFGQKQQHTLSKQEKQNVTPGTQSEPQFTQSQTFTTKQCNQLQLQQEELFKTVISRLSTYYQTIFNTLSIVESDLRIESNFERLIFNKLHAKVPDGLQKQPKIIQNVQLKPYQLEGVRFLASVYVNNVTEAKYGKYVPGVCLADDMGLGKTIQTITFLMYVTYQVNNSFSSNQKFGDNFGSRGRQKSIHLIVTPLPVSENWKNEFQRCVPDANILIYKGDVNVRDELKKEVLKPGRNISCIITTYDYVISDHTFFKRVTFDVVVIDEASRIKNCNSKLISVLRNEITCKFRLLLSGTPLQNTLKELFTLLQFIHGQIFNDFSQFEAVFSNIIGKQQNNQDESDQEDENSTAQSSISCLVSTASAAPLSLNTNGQKRRGRGKPKQTQSTPLVELSREQKFFIIQRLHGIIKPFMIRRVKADVLDQLPPKDEVLIRCGMSGIQIYLYSMAITQANKALKYQLNGIKQDKNARVDNITDLPDNLSEAKTANQENTTISDIQKQDKVVLPKNFIRNIEIYLRKVCNHPYIAIDHDALNQYQINLITTFKQHLPASEQTAENGVQISQQQKEIALLNYQYIRDSGKLSMLYVLLKKLKASGHKVLIFSQFKQMLTILEQFMQWAGHQYLRFDGDVKDEVRNQLVAQFNGEPGIFAFLLSTRAASHGLNLQSADTVIIYDSDYNAFYDLQAQDRCYRIGQTRPVRVFRLCTNSIVEQKLLQIAARKFQLSQAVIDAGGFDQNSLGNSTDDRIHNYQTGQDDQNIQGHIDGNVNSKTQLIDLLTSSQIIELGSQEDELIGKEINTKIARNAQEQRIFQKIDDELSKEMANMSVLSPTDMVDRRPPQISELSPDSNSQLYNINNINGIIDMNNQLDVQQTNQQFTNQFESNTLNGLNNSNSLQQEFQSQLSILNYTDAQGLTTNQYGFVIQQKRRGRRPLTEEEKKQQREKIVVRAKTVQHFINTEAYFALLDCLKNKVLQKKLQHNPFQFIKDFKIAFKKSQSTRIDFNQCIQNGKKYNIQFYQYYNSDNKNIAICTSDSEQKQSYKQIKSTQQLMQLYCDYVNSGFGEIAQAQSKPLNFIDNNMLTQINPYKNEDNMLQNQHHMQLKQQQITEYNILSHIFKIRQDTLKQRYLYMFDDTFQHIASWVDTDKLIDYSQVSLYQILSCSEGPSIQQIIFDLKNNLEIEIKDEFTQRYIKFISQRELLEINCKSSIQEKQIKELLSINELILVHLHIINSYGVEDLNYANVDVEAGQVFEELLCYPAVYFNMLIDDKEYREMYKQNDETQIGYTSLDYMHFKAMTLQYESSDEYLKELIGFFEICKKINKSELHKNFAQILLDLAKKAALLFDKRYKFMQEQILSIQALEKAPEDIIKFGVGHYGGTVMETMAYYLFRESKIKRVRNSRLKSDHADYDVDNDVFLKDEEAGQTGSYRQSGPRVLE